MYVVLYLLHEEPCNVDVANKSLLLLLLLLLLLNGWLKCMNILKNKRSPSSSKDSKRLE